MDKYNVSLTSHALRDMDGIYVYIAHTKATGGFVQGRKPESIQNPQELLNLGKIFRYT